jgi:hypothetical protein
VAIAVTMAITITTITAMSKVDRFQSAEVPLAALPAMEKF